VSAPAFVAGAQAWAVVTAAATRGIAAFPSQNVANLVWAYATLGRDLGAPLVAAAQDRMAEILDEFTPKVRRYLRISDTHMLFSATTRDAASMCTAARKHGRHIIGARPRRGGSWSSPAGARGSVAV